MTECLIGIDIGASGLRAALTPVGSATPLRTVTSPSPLRVGPSGILADEVAAAVAEVLGRLLAAQSTRIVAVAIGCAGISMQGEAARRRLPEVVSHLTQAPVVVVCSDTITSYLGALGWRPGAVVAAGTGAVGVGTDLCGQWRRVDGWGYNIGDAGGGSWIGRHGIDRALRAHDGRSGGSVTLLGRLTQRFGDPVILAGDLARRDDRAAIMAGFAPEVMAAAETDEQAASIIAEAGRQLAGTAVAALVPGTAPRLSTIGSLLAASDRLRAAFTDAVRTLMPDAELVPALGLGVDGAVLLAQAAVNDSLPDGTAPVGLLEVVRC